MVFGHADEAITATLEVEGAGDPFFAGDTVQATIILTTKKGGKVNKMRAGLHMKSRRQTASKKGDKDGEGEVERKWATEEKWLLEEQLLEDVELPRGLNNTYHLQWHVPDDALPSYRGGIIEHTYKVIVELERAEGKGIKEECEIQVVEPPPGKELQPGLYGDRKNSNDADMQFRLPKLEYVEGETLAGQVVVDARVNIEAKDVHLELCRIEKVREGDGENVKEERVQTHGLTGMTWLGKGEQATYDFSFPVELKGCPTFHHGDVEGSWLLKAVISRPLAVNCEVSQAVYLYSAYRQG